MTQATQADFFMEGLATPAQAPQDPDDLPNPANPGGISNNELRRRTLALQGNPMARQTQQRRANTPGIGLDSEGNPYSAEAPGTPTGRTMRDGSGNLVTVVADSPAQRDAYNAQLGTVSSAGFANGAEQLLFQPPSPYGAAPGGPGGFDVEQALATGNQMAQRVVNAQPTVPADKQVNVQNRDALTPVIDPAAARNAEVDRAFALSQDLYNRILNAPSQAALLGDQALSNQLALAKSARGGPGAVQEALGAAQAQAPELQRQTQQAVIAEEQQRNQAAQGALGIYSAVAGDTANREVVIAQANQGAGLHVLDNLTTLTGQEMQFDQTQMAVIGQLARDYMNNAAQFAGMSVQLQIAQWEDITRRYGIDMSFKAVVEQVAASENVGPLDAFKLILGGASALPGIGALFKDDKK